MDKKTKFIPQGASNIVYVRPVDISELPVELRQQAVGATELYAVHNEDGERLAVVNGKRLAFVLARQNDLAPVNVH